MLTNPVTGIKGIGEKKANILTTEAGIETVEDLLYYIPRRYIDRSSFKKIKDCFLNESVTVAGSVTHVSVQGMKRKHLDVEIDDGTDTISGVFLSRILRRFEIFRNSFSILFIIRL